MRRRPSCPPRARSWRTATGNPPGGRSYRPRTDSVRDPASQREPANSVALTLIAQAYRFKALYPQSIEAARKAIRINPKTAEPHLWLADSLRLSGKFAEAHPV